MFRNRLAPIGLRWWMAPVAMILAIAIDMITGMVTASLWAQPVRFALLLAVASLVPYLALRTVRRGHVGLADGLSWRAVVAACVGVVVLYAISLIYQHLIPAAQSSSAEVLKSIGFGGSAGRDLALISIICIGAPLAEEAVFRGIVFRSLLDACRSVMPPWAGLGIAAAASALAFAMIHGGEGQDGVIIALFLHGVVYALLYAVTGSLIVPILAHSLNNSFSMMEEVVKAGTYGWQSGPFWLIVLGPVIALCIALIWRAILPRP